jgi:hypothetical protein
VSQNNDWPQAADQPVGGPPTPPPPPGARKGKVSRKAIAGGAALLFIGIGIGASSNSESPKAPETVSVNGSTQEPAETSSTTAPAPTSTTTTEQPTTTTTTEAPTTTTTTSSPPAQAAKIRVPNVVGKDLQTAQDTMQAAGLYYLTSHDSTGLNRMQILDRNWLVTEQSPAAGSMVEADRLIDLGARKFTD